MRRTLAAALTLALLTVGCGDDDGDSERGLEPIAPPTFAPDSAAATTPTTREPGNPTTINAPSSATSESSGTTVTTTSAGPTTRPATSERVTFTDPVGDATPGVGLSAPPDWTDLAGGELERTGDDYRLHVRLAGEAPERSSGSNTMNIASFYDVDGDGQIDFEIWVNIDAEGYGPAWYDDRGRAAFGRDSGVIVMTAGDVVTLSFNGARIGSPDRLRFSLASEYGDISTIGSSFARRDDAPDDDRAVSFPG